MLGKRLDGVTVSYGFAHLGKISFWYASEMLLAYYLTEICGLPPAQMALILASSLLLSAAADLAVARLLQHRLDGPGPAVRLQMLGAGAAAGALLALFLGIQVPLEWRLAYGLLFAAAFRLGYVVLDLPQNVLMSMATDDAASRARLASLRLAMSSAGALLVSGAQVPLMSRQIAVPVAARFVMLAVLLAALAFAGAYALHRAVEAHVRAMPVPPSLVAERPSGMRLPPPLWANVALAFVLTLAVSCFTKVAPFYSAYFTSAEGRPLLWAVYLLPAASLGAALSQPAWAHCALRVPAPRLLIVGATLLAAAAAAFNQAAGHPAAALAAACGIGAGSSGIATLLWAAFAGMVAAQRQVSAAMAFGMLTAAMKVALACGALGIGAVLSAVDYRHGAAAALVDLMAAPPVVAALCVIAGSAAARESRLRTRGWRE